MSKKEEFIGQKIIVPGRLSYAHLYEKHQFPEEKEAHYRTQVLIPKTDSKTLKLIKDTIKKVFAQGVAKRLEGKKPNKWENPMHDGDVIADEKGEAYRNHVFINAKRKDKQPGIVDRRLQPIIDPEEVYSGCYANVSVTFFFYNRAGNIGVGVLLGNVQKIKDGEKLGFDENPEDDFDAVEMEMIEDDDFTSDDDVDDLLA